jgi:hypothetical protein
VATYSVATWLLNRPAVELAAKSVSRILPRATAKD